MAYAAPSDLDTSLIHDSTLAEGSGTGALIGFGQKNPLSELSADGRLRFIASTTSCYSPEQAYGNLFVTLTATGELETVKGAPCSDASVPNSIARATAYNAVRLPSGKLLLQTDTEGLDIRLRLIRLNADGSIDTSFGNNGQLIANKSDGTPILSGTGLRDAARMIIDGQGRLYISNGGAQIARLNADGTLDANYGTDGYANAPLAGGVITELAIDDNGRLVVTGRRDEEISVGSITVKSARFWLARFAANGQHDTTFRNELGGDADIVRLQAVTTGSPLTAGAITVENDGNLLVTVGNELRRYSSSGDLLGSATFPAEADAASGRSLAITLLSTHVDGTGRILVAGQGVNTSQMPLVRRAVVARLNADLSRDTSFDSGDGSPNGLRVHDLGASRSYPDTRSRFHVGSDGKITLVGRVDGQGSQVAVVRLKGDGSGGPAADGTPDSFDFGINENATANSVDTSKPITITGINVPVAISVNNNAQGRGYSIGCNGTFTAAPGTISNGQTVCVRHTTGSPGTTVITTLTVGGVTGNFESRVPQPAIDTEPDVFSFEAASGVEPGAVVESAALVITGTNAPAAISIVGGEYRLAGGTYTSAPGQIQPGQSVRVRVTAPAELGATATATLTVGGVSANFAVTTRMPAQASTATISGVPGGSISLSTAGGTLTNARSVAQPSGSLSGFQYPHGYYAFDVEDVTPGAEITVQITLPEGSRPDAYVKCSADGTSCAEFTGASFDNNVVTLILKDGGAGDADGTANGRIVDPGAPAVRDSAPPVTDGGDGGDNGSGGSENRRGGGGAMGAPLLALMSLFAVWRSRRRILG